MARKSKSVKLLFKTTPKGFYKRLEQELADAKIQGGGGWKDFEDSTPLKDGDLRASNRIKAGAGRVTISNRMNYASYVDKSGPRKGGPGMKGWFSKRANSKFVNKVARKLRNEMIKAQKKKSGK